MKKITIEVSDERYQDIQDRFAIDFGWEWNDNKDFAKQFSQWVVMQALDLDLDDCEEDYGLNGVDLYHAGEFDLLLDIVNEM